MKKLLSIITLSAALFLSVIQVSAQPLNINAKSYILIDSKTGQVLYGYNSKVKAYPASTTKIMTGILAIEYGDLDKFVMVNQSAIDDIGPGGMHIGLMAGEQLELRHVLNALMVRSANETGYVIAENISSSRQEFYDLMNKRAKELGATDTNFVNPCGIDNGKKGENHLTTASDLAKMARHAMTLPEFREIVQKTSYTIPPTNKHPEEVTIYTTNRLLTYSKYKSNYYTKITGIKTGYTDRAKYNLVSSAINDDGMELIAVVMGVDNYDNVFGYSKELLEYGFKNYSMKHIIASNSYIRSVPVADAAGNNNLDILAANDLKCLLPNDKDKQQYTIEENIDSNITAPVKKGDVMGFLEIKNNDVSLGKVDLVASRSIEKFAPPQSPKTIAFKSISDPLLKRVLIGTSIFLLMFVLLRFTLRKISRTVNSKRTGR